MKKLKKIIYIIDDDPNILELCKTRFPDYTFIGIFSLEKAKQALNTNIEIDLIILDYKLSKDNGFTLIPKIRQKKPWVPVIILTAFANKDTLLEAIPYKPDDIFEKPLPFELLNNSIQSLLNKKEPPKLHYKTIINHIISDYKNSHKEPLTLHEYATQFNCNYKYISRVFKETTGTSFHDFKLTNT